MRQVWLSFGKATLATIITLAAGIASGVVWAWIAPDSVATVGRWVQLGSGAFFLAAVLGLLGWEIQTYKGKTPHEKLNQWLYRMLHCAGMYVLFTSSAALILVAN